MNYCKICSNETKNKIYCSLKCFGQNKSKESKEIRKCLTCNADMYIYKKSKRKFCSLKCTANNPDVMLQKIKTAKKTCLEKYGVTSHTKTPEYKQKLKESIQDKYGVDSYFQTDQFKAKSKSTSLERYGTDFPSQSKEVKEKVKNVMMKRWGGFLMGSPIIRERIKITNQCKFGVKNPMQNSEIVDKVKNTNKKRYGTEWGLSNKEIIQKKNKTILDKYGVINISQVPEVRDKITLTNLKSSYEIVMRRCSNIVEPLFTLEEFPGVKYYDNMFKFKCLKCKIIFESSLYAGNIPRCPECYPLRQGTSIAEKEILYYIQELLPNIEIIKNDRKILSGRKELDIYIPSKKIAIEFDGLYWHSELNGKDKHYHLDKTLDCEKQNVRLIHIFEDEWIYKQEIVKSRLSYILGLQQKRIFARQTKIQKITPKVKNQFLEEIHLQGGDRSKIKLGAFYENELVAVMTFGAKRISLGSKASLGEYELIRFATKYNVVGIAGKLLKYFIKNYNPIKIISYADRRWSAGNLYEKLGFNKISDGSPGYWYIFNGNRIHRFNYRKDRLSEKLETFDSELTEWQNMQVNGYDRIWDCGSLKYEWVS